MTDFHDFSISTTFSTPPDYLFGFGYGNAYLILRLNRRATLVEIVEFLSDRQVNQAEWLDVGFVGNCPAVLYLNNEFATFMVETEGDEDGSQPSFGVHIERHHIPEFLARLAEQIEHLPQ